MEEDTYVLTHQGMVTVFYDKMLGRMPTVSEARYALDEELDELSTAVNLGAVDEEILKELTDVLYTCYGYAISRGWNLWGAFTATHVSNMTKQPTPHGKVLRGPDYIAPNMKEYL